MQERVKSLYFILNDVYERSYSGLKLIHANFPKPEQPFEIDNLKVTVIPSYQGKKGYSIECDGLSLFWLSGLSDDYISSKKDTKAIEIVMNEFPNVDLMLLGTPDGIGPEKGNGIREAYLKSSGLNAGSVFFMGKEPLARRVRRQILRRIDDPENIGCAENPGDRFLYSNRTLKKR